MSLLANHIVAPRKSANQGPTSKHQFENLPQSYNQNFRLHILVLHLHNRFVVVFDLNLYFSPRKHPHKKFQKMEILKFGRTGKTWTPDHYFKVPIADQLGSVQNCHQYKILSPIFCSLPDQLNSLHRLTPIICHKISFRTRSVLYLYLFTFLPCF